MPMTDVAASKQRVDKQRRGMRAGGVAIGAIGTLGGRRKARPENEGYAERTPCHHLLPAVVIGVGAMRCDVNTSRRDARSGSAARMVGTDVPAKGAGWPVDGAHLMTSLCSRSCGGPQIPETRQSPERRSRPMSLPEPISPNRYAALARRHYEMHLPDRPAEILEDGVSRNETNQGVVLAGRGRRDASRAVLMWRY